MVDRIIAVTIDGKRHGASGIVHPSMHKFTIRSSEFDVMKLDGCALRLHLEDGAVQDIQKAYWKKQCILDGELIMTFLYM